MNWFKKLPLSVKISIGFLFTVWFVMLINVPELTLGMSIVAGIYASLTNVICHFLD